MNQDALKRNAAEAALRLIEPLLTPDSIVGVGTGSTANYFIEGLQTIRHHFAAAVSSSEASAERLESAGIRVVDLNEAETLAVYVDGADEVALGRELIKGGGGALTREKIVAAAADRFICIVDESKRVSTLGAFPLPVEVIPMARRLVADRLRDLGGDPVLRAEVVTDNGNQILDVHGLAIDAPATLETRINNIPGVVENGIFAVSTRPHTVLVATPAGVVRSHSPASAAGHPFDALVDQSGKTP